MAGEKPAPQDTSCPRCGEAAQILDADPQVNRVDINCPTCGSFRVSREECREALKEMEAEDDETPTPG
jgi:predicted RNA-binding Zn-ribbon protein involved in translation (DUF1610 family)